MQYHLLGYLMNPSMTGVDICVRLGSKILSFCNFVVLKKIYANSLM